MPKIARITGATSAIELGFVERERAPEPLMRLGVHLHLAGLSLSKTTSERLTNQFGNHFRNAEPTTVENWLQAFPYCWNQLI